MRRWTFGVLAFSLALIAAWGIALAQYRHEAEKPRETTGDGSFEGAVDLDRFRQGNLEWDTQELIASGFRALHRDNQQVLKELAELKATVKRIDKER